MAARRRLNATAASLLGFLHEGPLSGWDLVQLAEERIGDFWSLTQSQVYRELNTMAAEGLIEAGERGSRERQPYTLTDAGREAFQAWLAEPPGAESIRFPLLLTLSFAQHLPPERVAAIVAQHRAVHEARLAAYEAHEQSLAAAPEPLDPATTYRAIVLDFGLTYERAVLAWFDRLERRWDARPAEGER